MAQANLLEQLVDALKVLPGVGVKTAQRMAFYLLERNREGATRLAERLKEAVERIGHCARCRTLTEEEICPICRHAGRDQALL